MRLLLLPFTSSRIVRLLVIFLLLNQLTKEQYKFAQTSGTQNSHYCGTCISWQTCRTCHKTYGGAKIYVLRLCDTADKRVRIHSCCTASNVLCKFSKFPNEKAFFVMTFVTILWKKLKVVMGLVPSKNYCSVMLLELTVSWHITPLSWCCQSVKTPRLLKWQLLALQLLYWFISWRALHCNELSYKPWEIFIG